MGIKEEAMTENKKEIIVKAVKVEDSKIGPRIGICDMEGTWYNSNKKSWEKHPGAWETLSGTQRGSRLDLVWEVRSYPKKDGTTGYSKGYSNEISSFEPVLQKGDEVRPVDAPPQESLPGKTRPVMQDMSPKQTAIKSATDIVVAMYAAGIVVNEPTKEVLDRAHVIHGEMLKEW